MGATRPSRALAVGIVAAPGACTDLATALEPGLADRIATRLPGAEWKVRLVSDRLVQWPADLSQLIGAARRRMFGEGWDLAVCITDLPLQTARRPVVAHASMTHGVAVLSLPALGAVSVNRRAGEAIVRLVTGLVGDADGTGNDSTDPGRRAAVDQRLNELGGWVLSDGQGFGYVAGVASGNLRLLLGMLRANRPWRLAIRLSRALVATLATGVFALVTSDLWRLADGLGPLRLALLALSSTVAVGATIVIGAGLWERQPRGTPAREQVILFNLVTVTTVAIGVLALYVALLILTLVGAFLLIPRQTLADGLGHPAGVASVLQLAWLATSVATMGGALGAGLESDEAVREAAYRYQPDEPLSR